LCDSCTGLFDENSASAQLAVSDDSKRDIDPPIPPYAIKAGRRAQTSKNQATKPPRHRATATRHERRDWGEQPRSGRVAGWRFATYVPPGSSALSLLIQKELYFAGEFGGQGVNRTLDTKIFSHPVDRVLHAAKLNCSPPTRVFRPSAQSPEQTDTKSNT
jgi:hypothetical protein